MPLYGGPSGQATGLPVPGVGTAPQTLAQGIEGVPIIVNGQIIGWNIGGEFFTQEEVDALIATGQFPEEPSTGGAAGRTQFESERALDIAQAERLRAQIAQDQADLAENRRQFDIAQANDDRRLMQQLQAQIDLEEMRIENSKRELVYSMGMQERSTLIGQKAETGREIMRMGPDPFRQGAILGGGVQRGTTPQQTVTKQAQAFMQQPLPEVSMDMDVAQLEQALSQMQGQGMTQPQFGTGFGMAQGGTVEAGGAASMKPKMSYLVGEGKHGQGLAAGTAEILTIGNGKVEVTPFGGGAQSGMEISGLQALSPLYTDFPFSKVPRATTGMAGVYSPYGPGGKNMPFSQHGLTALGTMGYQPDLVRFGGPEVYYRDPATGSMRHVGSRSIFEETGFNWQDVMNLAPETKGAFSFGPQLTQPLPAGQIGQETGGFGSLGTPLMEASTGAILPAVHKIARQLAQWRAAGDYRYDLAIMAYGNALDPTTGLPTGGLSPQYIDSIVNAATPQAGAFGGRRIGFTGGYM